MRHIGRPPELAQRKRHRRESDVYAHVRQRLRKAQLGSGGNALSRAAVASDACTLRVSASLPQGLLSGFFPGLQQQEETQQEIEGGSWKGERGLRTCHMGGTLSTTRPMMLILLL